MIIHKLNREEIVGGEIIDADNFPFLIGCDMQDLEDLVCIMRSIKNPTSMIIHWLGRLEQITGPMHVDNSRTK